MAIRMASHTRIEPVQSPPQPQAERAMAPGAIVIGASSGIGAALVRQLVAEGWSVAALARRADALAELARECAGGPGRVLVLAHDTRDSQAVADLLERIARDFGRIDLCIYAAGVMPKIERQSYDTALDLDMLAINFGGLVAWGNAVAGLFRTQRSGILVGISSIAGDRGRKGNPMYGASKAAMDHFLEALRNRLAEFNVHVCTIKPGYIDTPMTRGMPGLFWLISAEQAAATILAAARGGANVRYVPWRWKIVGLVIKSIPSFLFRKLNF